MKQIILALVLSVGFGPAFADGDVLAPLKLSSKCEDSIFKKAEGLCNVDSKNDPARDHCLFWGDVNIL